MGFSGAFCAYLCKITIIFLPQIKHCRGKLLQSLRKPTQPLCGYAKRPGKFSTLQPYFTVRIYFTMEDRFRQFTLIKKMVDKIPQKFMMNNEAESQTKLT